jgi:antitoxin ChpS
MTKATLRPVGGSTVVAIPPAMLQQLGLGARSTVQLSIENGTLVIAPTVHRPNLDDLLAQCDPTAPLNADERAWLRSAPLGNEAI